MRKETHVIEGGRKLYMYTFDDNRAAERQRRFWNTVADAWRNNQEEIEEWMLPVTRAMNDRIGNYPRRALDVGSGAQPMSLPDKWRVVGVDPASEMISGGRSVQGDSQQLPFQDAAFDAVVSRFAIMLACDPLGAFREAHRVLRLGGTITLAVWDTSEKNTWVSPAESILARSLDIRTPEPNEPSAYRLADPTEVAALLGEAGFRVVSTESVLLPYLNQRNADETFEFLLRFIGPIRTMFEKLPDERRAQVRAEAVAALDGVSRNGTAWIHHATREPKIL